MLQARTAASPVAARGRLSCGEIAEAAVLVDVTVALCLLGFLLPVGAPFLVLASIPMAALGARRRPRAVLAGALTGVVTSFLVGGVGLTSNVAGCAIVGGYCGMAVRRGWSRMRAEATAIIAMWPPLAAILLAGLAALPKLRRLTLVQVTNSWRAGSKTFRSLGLKPVAHLGDVIVSWLVRRWWFSGPLGLLTLVVAAIFVGYGLAKATLARLQATGPPAPDLSPIPASRDDERVAAVPVEVDKVSFRYQGASTDALAGVSMAVEPADFVAVVGRNGSGKSTLAAILAGRPPTTGCVRRPGSAGFGQHGGTALVFQRPETQVLGVRARDDVVWGLPADRTKRVDVAELLRRVGLDGFADRETSTLSGGELQRLALAAALARSPALLLSDETTAMVDPEGRRAIVDVLHQASADGMAIVHVTHRWEEATGATRVLALEHGRAVDPRPAPAARPRRPIAPGERDAVIELAGVGHVYARGTPWEHRALADVDLVVHRGDGVLITGANGSGKSTLAWVLAGLIEPSEGDALLDGRPLSQCVGRVGVAFQHARLQLLRPTVRSDVRSAGGVGDAAADRALELVGLDPVVVGARPVDELSGGQQRRVALAGVLAADPPVVVLDEPFAGLDDAGQMGVADVIANLRERGTAVVVVSHDTEGLGDVLDREVRLEDGRIVGQVGATDAGPGARKRTRELHLFRLVPRDSAVHRLWAGTKLLALVALSVGLSMAPGWPSVGVAAVFVGGVIMLARIPRGAAPRLPRWFVWGLVASAAFALVSGGKPDLAFAGVNIGLGALNDWARVTAFAVVLITGAAIVSWTTPLADVAPALRTLGAPGRRLGLPLDEWTTTLALGLRFLPLLIDETRTLTAVRRLRAPRPTADRERHRPSRGKALRLIGEALDLLNAEIVVALRRARELSAAMEARGGLGAAPDDRTWPGGLDFVALVTVAAIVAVIVIV